jgi:hypothetical protein
MGFTYEDDWNVDVLTPLAPAHPDQLLVHGVINDDSLTG